MKSGDVVRLCEDVGTADAGLFVYMGRDGDQVRLSRAGEDDNGNLCALKSCNTRGHGR